MGDILVDLIDVDVVHVDPFVLAKDAVGLLGLLRSTLGFLVVELRLEQGSVAHFE